MGITTKWAAVLTLVALVTGEGIAAQEVSRHITVTGSGVVSVKPDTARIMVGVQARGETAKAALDEMSSLLDGVFSALDDAGIVEENRQTTALSLDPLYVQQERDGRNTREISGYRAMSMLSIRVADIGGAGALIDRLTQAGANRIDSISFEISEPEAAAATARQRAVENARQKAGEYAEAAEVSLGEVVSISEHGSAAPRPMMSGARMAEASFAVPVAEGSIEVEAQVTVIFRIADGQ
ncbi:SIMPL domain-containing protein [Amaricoccus macauensis]|uniref:SIMPL domain-containing protein n=1 Tax=Amaricoccus macauensis TaxID=57001 RepID=UPI003C7E1376